MILRPGLLKLKISSLILKWAASFGGAPTHDMLCCVLLQLSIVLSAGRGLDELHSTHGLVHKSGAIKFCSLYLVIIVKVMVDCPGGLATRIDFLLT